jgi:hypothetical protein
VLREVEEVLEKMEYRSSDARKSVNGTSDENWSYRTELKALTEDINVVIKNFDELSAESFGGTLNQKKNKIVLGGMARVEVGDIQ